MESSIFKNEVIDAFTNVKKVSWLIAQSSFFKAPFSTDEKVVKLQTMLVLATYYKHILKGNDPYMLYVIVKVVFNGRRGFKLDESAHLNSFSDFVTASLHAHQTLSSGQSQLEEKSNSVFVWSIISKYFTQKVTSATVIQ